MQQQRRPQMIAAGAAVLALSCASLAGAAAASGEPQRPLFKPAAPITGQLDPAGLRRLAGAPWRSYRKVADAPTIHVSSAYADPGAIARRWASFFQSLIHGSELSLLNAYVAPLDEVRKMCGNTDVLGCYGDDHLVIPDQGAGGIASTSIATHEYGHHVAFNRVNPPWAAIDWGTKRWATYERACPRAGAGTAYPGAEGANYSLNPGEAFAESYRVLNETTAGLPLMWPIVDPSFQPDAAALVAVRQDVLDPWTAPTVSVRRVRFSKGVRKWTMQIATPLDGELHAQVQPGSDDVTVFAADGRTLLARGSWTASGAKALDYGICGQRTIVLRVTRDTPIRHLVLRLSVP
jgi:hypothetical protein